MGVEDYQWNDPLLITPDVSWQQNLTDFSQRTSITLPSLHNSITVNRCDISPIEGSSITLPSSCDSVMVNPCDTSPIAGEYTSQNLMGSPIPMPSSLVPNHEDLCSIEGEDISWQDQNLKPNITEEPIDPIPNGCSVLGFSLATPDLVICASSPDVPRNCYNDPFMFLEAAPVEISLEDGINGPEKLEASQETVATKFSESCTEASLELVPVQKTLNESSCDVDEEFREMRVEYEFQKEELSQTRKALEELKRENTCKSRECQEALKSLRDLQNELMRKSMHVGSLAFAIEGQVKEKSKWFSSLRDLKRKLKLLKMDQLKLAEEALSYKQCLDDMNNISCSIQSKLIEEVKAHEDLKLEFLKGAKERKELYNKILELKGNIRVFCRCRPLNHEEIDSGATMAIDFEASKDGELTVKSSGLPKKTFKFDAVFGPLSNQVDVFEDTAPFATSVLDGYNVCIFAYGQTGTGKTFTMEGTNEARGVNYRTLQELFNIISERQGQFQYDISVSVLEVYNEQIRDLLLPGTQPGVAPKRLEIRQDVEGNHHVPGLVEARVNDVNEVWEVLKVGSDARAVGSTNANEYSSRSHCIHCVMVKGKNLLNGESTRSKLWLVDLAGSERVAKTEVQGERLKETQNINRSLSALGDVISALATKSPHIPFRNSKLTHLLQDSLGGDSKTLMFAQISPNENDLSETLCSLNFASRVRGIELGPAKKQVDNTELIKYKQTTEKNKLELKSKDVHIKKMEDTIHCLDVRVKEKDIKNKLLQDKIKELESQLLIERKLARQHVDSKLAEHRQQQQFIKQEEPNTALTRLPLTIKPIGTYDNFTDDVDDKENIPKLAPEQPLMNPKRTGRASFCPVSIAPNPPSRRNSLIPLPSSTLGIQKFSSKPLVPSIKEIDIEPTSCFSPKEQRKNGAKKMSFVLRRSVQRRIQRSPMNQGVSRGGSNATIEKVRAHRVLVKQNQRERGWNIGNAGKVAI